MWIYIDAALRPQVVANAVAALADIYDESGKDIIAQNPQLLNKLLAALNECNEYVAHRDGGWGVARGRPCTRVGVRARVSVWLCVYVYVCWVGTRARSVHSCHLSGRTFDQMGPSVHFGCTGQVQAGQQPRRGVYLRARQPAPDPRQRRRRPLRRQGTALDAHAHTPAVTLSYCHP
jgi:hypothetical protein